jgi:hypothetical protein
MCRNIKLLHHFEPPATVEEVQASALQYVRKVSGMRHASRANRAAFDLAVKKVSDATLELFDALVVHGPPRSREAEKAKAAERGRKREEQTRKRVLATLR